MEQIFNRCEAVLWVTVAMVLMTRAFRERGSLRGVFATLAIAFLAFRISDVIESRTGAWWQPWWLAVWKTGCVAFLALGFRRYYAIQKARRNASGTTTGSTPPPTRR